MTRILHLSDTHVLMPPDLVSGRLATYDRFTAAIDEISARFDRIAPIDAVLVTGDLTDRGDAASFAGFRRQIERLDRPCYLIPGNHDRREAMRACFQDQAYMPDSGRLNWQHDLGDIHLIGLDTLVEGAAGGVLDHDTLAFLEGALSQAGTKPVLIAMHHPPFQSGIDFMDAIGLAGTEDLAAILSRSDADIRILCGHVHCQIVSSVGGKVALAAPATSSRFAADNRATSPTGFFEDRGGYMIHEWAGGFRSMTNPLGASDTVYPF